MRVINCCITRCQTNVLACGCSGTKLSNPNQEETTVNTCVKNPGTIHMNEHKNYSRGFVIILDLSLVAKELS